VSGLSAVLVALAVLVWRPPSSWVLARVRGVAVPRPGRRVLVATVAGALPLSLLSLPAAPAILVWTGAGVVVAAARRVVRARERRRRTAVREEADGVVDALVAELRSGAPPAVALERLAVESGLLAPAAVAAAAGGDVPSALVAAGSGSGAAPLADVGRAWAVSDACGAPLVRVLEQVREAAREDRELRREVASGVAPARATASLVAAMPPLGLALGTGLGVDPLSVVLTTVPGALCVAVGVACAVAGVLWIDLIADRAEAGA